MQHRERITDQSPVIRLPVESHRRAKAWAALQGLSLRQAMCLLIDRVYTSCELAGHEVQLACATTGRES